MDVAKINLSNVINRELLQPVDVWAERTIRILANQQLNKQAVANWIVTHSLTNSVSPEHVNMGIWFFCSQIIASEYKLNRTLANYNTAQNLLNDYRNRAKSVSCNCQNF